MNRFLQEYAKNQIQNQICVVNQVDVFYFYIAFPGGSTASLGI